MNSAYVRRLNAKYVLFSMIFSVLAGILKKGPDEDKVNSINLEEIIKKLGCDSYIKEKENEVCLAFFKENNKYLKELSRGILSKESKELLEKHKNVLVKISEGAEINASILRMIVEEIKPTELYIYNANIKGENKDNESIKLNDSDIRDIKLNSNLNYFILVNSNITNMDGLFGNWIKKLIRVNISYNSSLKSFPTGLLELASNLVELNISGNNLKSMPKELKSFTNLETLHISHNPDISENWNSLSNKDIKEYNNNPLESIIVLNMNENKLGSIGKKKLFSLLKQFPNIEALGIGGNELKTVPLLLEKSKELKLLDISNNSDIFKNMNKKEDISNFFSRFSSLDDLRISNNNLSGIISIPLKNLERLDISYNEKLEGIEIDSEPLTELKVLNMCNCKKLNIDSDFAEKNLKYIMFLNIMSNNKDNNYSWIYSLENLKCLCANKDMIDIGCFRKYINITDNLDDYDISLKKEYISERSRNFSSEQVRSR